MAMANTLAYYVTTTITKFYSTVPRRVVISCYDNIGTIPLVEVREAQSGELKSAPLG
jgi:hypothetical protein